MKAVEMITLVVVICAAVGLVLWKLGKLPADALSAVTGKIGVLNYGTATSAVDTGAGASAGAYTKYVSQMPPIQSTLVKVGTMLTPTPILQRAAEQGVDFKQSLYQNGDLARYEELPGPARELVTIGEGLSRTFMGMSPYEAGRATREWLHSQGLG